MYTIIVFLFFFFLNSTFIRNRSRDFQYNVDKKYAPNHANGVAKCKISLCNPHQGPAPWNPHHWSTNWPPFPAAGSAPGASSEHLLASKLALLIMVKGWCTLFFDYVMVCVCVLDPIVPLFVC